MSRADRDRRADKDRPIMHGCSLLVVQFEALNFGAWFEALGGSEGGIPIRLRRALAHGAEIMFGVLVGILRLDVIAS